MRAALALSIIAVASVLKFIAESFLDDVANNRRVGPRVLSVQPETAVLEDDAVERFVEPSARAIREVKIYWVPNNTWLFVHVLHAKISKVKTALHCTEAKISAVKGSTAFRGCLHASDTDGAFQIGMLVASSTLDSSLSDLHVLLSCCRN